MGKILNVEITSGTTVFSNGCYEWCAYTDEALKIANVIANNYLAIMDKYHNGVCGAVALLDSTGARLSDITFEKYTYLPSELRVKADDNSYGVIHHEDGEINRSRDLEDAFIEFDIYAGVFNLYGCFDLVDKYNYYLYKNCPIFKVDYDLSRLTCDELHSFIEMLRNKNTDEFLIQDVTSTFAIMK